MPNRPLFQPVALAGAVAISASLIGFAALPQASAPPAQTLAVQLTSGESELIAPIDGAAQADGYSFADLITSVQNTVSYGDGWFSSAETAFSHGEYPLALSEGLAGFNNLTVGVGNDLLTNGYAALTGSDGNAGYDLINPGQPVDFASALIQVHTDLADIQQDLNVALTEFANGDSYFGLVNLGQISIDSTSATDAVILGLFDSLTGAPETAAAVPAAAYPFSDLLLSIESTTTAGEHFFSLAESAFANGNYPVALDEALAGFNNLTTGVGSDLLVNGYAALTGDGGNAGYALDTHNRAGELHRGPDGSPRVPFRGPDGLQRCVDLVRLPATAMTVWSASAVSASISATRPTPSSSGCSTPCRASRSLTDQPLGPQAAGATGENRSSCTGGPLAGGGGSSSTTPSITRLTRPLSRSKFSVPCWKFCLTHCGSWNSELVGRPSAPRSKPSEAHAS